MGMLSELALNTRFHKGFAVVFYVMRECINSYGIIRFSDIAKSLLGIVVNLMVLHCFWCPLGEKAPGMIKKRQCL